MSNYLLNEWRLLVTPASAGAWNMAVDEAIMQAVEQNKVPATLRLYAWEPACLSIGYAQHSAEIDLDQLHHYGWDWVRRPTGGRAILHTDELTYSVIAPLNEPRVAGGVLESYQRLSLALLTSLRNLGLPAESQANKSIGNNQVEGPVCFEVPSNYEITVQGKKLVGSAQSRKRNVMLQHGTLPMRGDLTRITLGLRFPDQAERSRAAAQLLEHATTVEACLGKQLSWQQAAQAFIDGFQSELNLRLVPGELTREEIELARQLKVEKYAHPSWLERL